MPFTLFHGLLSYLPVSFLSKDRRLWLLAFVAGMLPDLDGIPILFNRALYYQVHHELFHAPIYGLVLAIPVALLLRKFFGVNARNAFFVFAGSFAFHGIVDVFFTNWPVKIFWPLSNQEFSFPLLINYNSLLVVIVVVLFLAQVIFLAKKKPASLSPFLN